jgi:hypothetical protein
VTPRTLGACASVLDRYSQSSSSVPSRELMLTRRSSRARTLTRARPRAASPPPTSGARASSARTPASSRCSSVSHATSSRASDVDASRPQRYGTATTCVSASSPRAKDRPRVTSRSRCARVRGSCAERVSRVGETPSTGASSSSDGTQHPTSSSQRACRYERRQRRQACRDRRSQGGSPEPQTATKEPHP